MSERKTLNGGMDPRELQKRAAESRKRNREAQQNAIHEAYADIPLEQLGPKVLRELASNPKTPESVRAQAAKALIDVPDENDEGDWRASVQVRPDYTPPSWEQVLRVAKEAGAI